MQPALLQQRRLGLSLILSRAIRPRRINVDNRSQREHANVVAEQIDRGLHCSERLRRSVDAHDDLVAPAARFAWREAYRGASWGRPALLSATGITSGPSTHPITVHPNHEWPRRPMAIPVRRPMTTQMAKTMNSADVTDTVIGVP